MKTITEPCFQTEDGKIFNNKKEADKHEMKLRLEKLIDLNCTYHKHNLIRDVIAYRKEIFQALKDFGLDKPEVSWTPAEKDDDLMSLEDFVRDVEEESIISYDGIGYYATQTEVSSIKVDLSRGEAGERGRQIRDKAKKEGYTHIAWYNR